MQYFTLFGLSLCLLSACNNPANNHDNHPKTDSNTLENRPPETAYKPAFSGQTRAPEIKTQTAYQVTIIAENIGGMWAITPLPNGNLLATVKEGWMVVINPNTGETKRIDNVPKVNFMDQAGLLDVILDPDFATNRTIYFTFSEPDTDGSDNDHTALAKAKLSTDETKLEQVQIIYRTFPSINSGKHYGSRLAFDKEGYLFMTVGERSVIETRPLAQDLSTPLGKLLRLNKDGKAAPNNPFAGQDKALPEIYSLGLRNAQSLAINKEGQIWEVEHGPLGGDELNLMEAGKNYGWPTISYGLEYSGEKIGEGITQRDGLVQPVYYWDPVIAPSGAVFYYGNIDEWHGNLFIGGLKDRLLVRVILQNNKVVGEEHLMKDQKDRIRAMTVGTDGHLYVVGDLGKVYKLSKK